MQQALYWTLYLHPQEMYPPLLLCPTPIHLSYTQWCVKLSSISQACLPSKACQNNCDKYFAQLCHDWYHAYPHTSPGRLGASAMRISPPDNQQATQVRRDNNNGKNTLFSVSPVSSIATAILWRLWLKNPVFFNANKISLADREHLGIPSVH